MLMFIYWWHKFFLLFLIGSANISPPDSPGHVMWSKWKQHLTGLLHWQTFIYNTKPNCTLCTSPSFCVHCIHSVYIVLYLLYESSTRCTFGAAQTTKFCTYPRGVLSQWNFASPLKKKKSLLSDFVNFSHPGLYHRGTQTIELPLQGLESGTPCLIKNLPPEVKMTVFQPAWDCRCIPLPPGKLCVHW